MLIKKHAECNMQHSLLCCRFSMFYLLIRPLLGLIPAWCYQHNIYTDFVDKLQYSNLTHFLHHVHHHIRHPAATGCTHPTPLSGGTLHHGLHTPPSVVVHCTTGCTHPPQWWYTAPLAAHTPLSGGTLYHGLHTPPSVVVHCTTGCTHPPQWWHTVPRAAHTPLSGGTLYHWLHTPHPPQWWYTVPLAAHTPLSGGTLHHGLHTPPSVVVHCTTSFCV